MPTAEQPTVPPTCIPVPETPVPAPPAAVATTTAAPAPTPPAPLAAGELDDRDRALVALLASGQSKTEAAAQLGVSVETAYRRSRKPAFRAALSDARRAAFARPAANALAVLPLGIERLKSIVSDDEAPLSAVIRATEALANITVRLLGHYEQHKLAPASEFHEGEVLDDLLIDPANAEHARFETMARQSRAKSAAARRGKEGYADDAALTAATLGGVPKAVRDRLDRAKVAVGRFGDPDPKTGAYESPEHEAAFRESVAAKLAVRRAELDIKMQSMRANP